MFSKETAYKIFKIAWIYLLVINIMDFNFSTGMDLISFIHFAQSQNLKYLPFFILAVIIIPFRDYKQLRVRKDILIILFVLFLLICAGFVSAFLSNNSGTAIAFMMRFSICFLILVYLVFVYNYFPELNEFLIKSFVYINLIIVAGSILDFYVPAFHNMLIDYFGRPLIKHSYVDYNGEIIMRPMGFITESNLAALSIAFASLLVLISSDKFNLYFRITYYLLGSFVLGMLVSRSAFIFSLLVLGYLFFFQKNLRKELYIYLLMFLLIPLLTPQTQSKIFQVSYPEKISEELSVGRPMIWQASLSAFKTSPVIGIGPDCFFSASRSYLIPILSAKEDINIQNPYSENYFEINNVNPHGLFIALLTETGIIGLALFCFACLLLFKYYYKYKLYISFVFLVGWLIISAISSYAPYYTYYLILCIIFFMISSNNMKIENSVKLD